MTMPCKLVKRLRNLNDNNYFLIIFVLDEVLKYYLMYCRSELELCFSYHADHVYFSGNVLMPILAIGANVTEKIPTWKGI